MEVEAAVARIELVLITDELRVLVEVHVWVVRLSGLTNLAITPRLAARIMSTIIINAAKCSKDGWLMATFYSAHSTIPLQQ